MVAEFERVMQATAPGQISEPFRSEFGWHVLRVEDRRQHDASGEAKRAQARETIRKRKVEEETDIWLRRLRDEAYIENRLSPPAAARP
jgi:peptidyl-prolyl cis-trans isomerase SurA